MTVRLDQYFQEVHILMVIMAALVSATSRYRLGSVETRKTDMYLLTS